MDYPYLQLTEEEVAQFPALQTAIHALEGSNQTQVAYHIPDKEASQLSDFFFDKRHESPHLAAFEFRGVFYQAAFGFGLSGITSGTPPVPELRFAVEGVGLISGMLLITIHQTRKKRPRK